MCIDNITAPNYISYNSLITTEVHIVTHPQEKAMEHRGEIPQDRVKIGTRGNTQTATPKTFG